MTSNHEIDELLREEDEYRLLSSATCCGGIHTVWQHQLDED